jgi:hypothetical protein
MRRGRALLEADMQSTPERKSPKIKTPPRKAVFFVFEMKSTLSLSSKTHRLLGRE